MSGPRRLPFTTVYKWRECLRAGTAAAVIPTVLGRGNYEATGDDQLILVFVGKDGAAEAPQTRTWRRCGDTLTLWRGESERSYTRTRDGTFEHCEE